MKNYTALDGDFEAIKNFLNSVFAIADTEIAAIYKRDSAGEVHNGPNSLPSALSMPLKQEEIAIRAALCEVSALVERHLQHLALDIYNSTDEHDHSAKLMADLSFAEARQIIERQHLIYLRDVPGFAGILHIQEMVNVLKQDKESKTLHQHTAANPESKLKISREEIYQAIDETRSFLKTLWEQLELCSVKTSWLDRQVKHIRYLFHQEEDKAIVWQ